MVNKQTVLLLILVFALILPGCTPAAQPVAAAAQATEEAVASTPAIEITETATAIATATPIPPSPTPAASNTPLPTATPEKLATEDGGFSAWCMPKDIVYSKEDLAKTGTIPEGAKVGTYNSDGVMELLIQVESCTLEYTFNQDAPSDLTLNVYDLNPLPFITKPMVVTSDQPNVAFTTLTHDYIIDPPFWTITYRIEVVDGSGTVISSQNVIFKRSWFAGFCWRSEIPDPITFKCPEHGEGHPWDPWYGWDIPKEMQNSSSN